MRHGTLRTTLRAGAILGVALLAACGNNADDRTTGGAATGAGTGAAIGLVGGPIGVVVGAVNGGGRRYPRINHRVKRPVASVYRGHGFSALRRYALRRYALRRPSHIGAQ